MISCDHCGQQISPGARFCMYCGTDVAVERSGLETQRISTGTVKATRDQALVEALRKATVGVYDIIGELGRGGMAAVFLAHDIAHDRRVAIKVIAPEAMILGQGIVERFQREAQTAAVLDHPNIIPIYAAEESEQLFYFVMKYVQGRTLDSVLREKGQLPLPMVQTILQQAGSALTCAHEKGVIHRDIKPGNLMLDENGLVMVTDFGIAKVLESENLTMTGATIGTPAYMSPEQCVGSQLTGAADQYSLGVVAFEMLTGRPPFEGDSPMTMMYRHAHELPPPITEVWPGCPPLIGATVMRMLAKRPEDRWPSIAAAVEALGVAAKAEEHRVRTEMVTLARSGSRTGVEGAFKTPRSPIPSGKSARMDPDSSATTPLAETLVAEKGVGARTGRRRSLVLLGAPILAVGAVGVWVVWGANSPVESVVSTPPVGRTESTIVRQPPPLSPSPPRVTALLVAPGSAAVRVGQTVPLSAMAVDSGGRSVSGVVVGWESVDAAVATVTGTGLVTAVAAGSARIIATSSGQSGSAMVTVEEPPPPSPPSQRSTRRSTRRTRVASVAVSPNASTLVAGDQLLLAASPQDAGGRPLTGLSVGWTTSNPAVVTVSETGVVTARAEGTARITATVAGRSVSATVTVNAAPVAVVRVSPARPTIGVGEATRLTVALEDTRSNSLDRPVTWRSSNPSTASVSDDGVVTGEGPGSALITATAEGRTGNATVTVEAPPPLTSRTPAVGAPEDPAVVREKIESVVQEYARALESRDMNTLRAAYPGITDEQQRAWSDFFRHATDLTVTVSVGDLDVQGDVAQASVDGALEYRTDRATRQDISFRVTLRHDSEGWRLTTVQ